MNITELARQLKVTTKELFEKLPQLGFDIGRRAIKVDDQIADRIIEVWKKEEKQKKEINRIEKIRGQTTDGEEAPKPLEEIKEVKIPLVITVREFAHLLNLPVNKVLTELLKNGVLASINERIDFDTASIIGEELGFKIMEDKEKKDNLGILTKSQERLQTVLSETGKKLELRPPVVVVMGHVDHGKTKILDAIRKTDVVAGESGGITQHIGAYQVYKNNRLITFIDTPGHEAFTAMRARGARVADLAILVIAADDGIQPQTKEAIKIIQAAKLPFIVAINKIDKHEVNIDKIKQELAAINLLPEDWGGKIACVPVSAKIGTGINELLETILLLADLEKEKIMADPARLAIGTIIESHLDKGEGPVATILVQAGTLKLGDILSFEKKFFGKVKALKDYTGQTISQALPGTPVKILGLKIVPHVGDILEVSTEVKFLDKKDVKYYRLKQEKDFSVQIKHSEDNDSLKFINLIIKADVLGSLEAIIESLTKLETPEIKIKIITKGLGMITETDVLKAESAKTKILGFHVKPSTLVAELAREKNVEIKYYEIIYQLLADIEKEIEAMSEKKISRRLLGKAEIIKIFRSEANNMIVGGRVIAGEIKVCETVIVTRNNVAIVSGRVKRLECAKEAVDKAGVGQECGINFEGEPIIKEGDVLEFYK